MIKQVIFYVQNKGTCISIAYSVPTPWGIKSLVILAHVIEISKGNNMVPSNWTHSNHLRSLAISWHWLMSLTDTPSNRGLFRWLIMDYCASLSPSNDVWIYLVNIDFSFDFIEIMKKPNFSMIATTFPVLSRHGFSALTHCFLCVTDHARSLQWNTVLSRMTHTFSTWTNHGTAQHNFHEIIIMGWGGSITDRICFCHVGHPGWRPIWSISFREVKILRAC